VRRGSSWYFIPLASAGTAIMKNPVATTAIIHHPDSGIENIDFLIPAASAADHPARAPSGLPELIFGHAELIVQTIAGSPMGPPPSDRSNHRPNSDAPH